MSMMRILTGCIEKSKDLQIGPSTLLDVVTGIFPVGREKVDEDLKKESDIGVLGSEYLKQFKTVLSQAKPLKPLEIKEITDVLRQIAITKGKGSREMQRKLLIDLCSRCTKETEMKFILRILKVLSYSFAP